MVPMPEQKAQLEVLKMSNFMFDHKGVQIIELNFKGKKKECFYIRSSNSQVKTSKKTFSKL